MTYEQSESEILSVNGEPNMLTDTVEFLPEARAGSAVRRRQLCASFGSLT
jgi:hypothetical protein